MSAKTRPLIFDVFLKFEEDEEVYVAEAQLYYKFLRLTHVNMHSAMEIRIQNKTNLYRYLQSWFSLSCGGSIDVSVQKIKWIYDEENQSWLRLISIVTSELTVYIKPVNEADRETLQEWLNRVKTHLLT